MAPQKFFWLKYIYKFFYKYTDAVVQDSKVSQLASFKYGASILNNEIIEIGIDFEKFNDNLPKGRARKKLNVSDDELIVFSSRGMRPIYNIDVIVKSIPIVKKSFNKVKFIFCSNYGELSKISTDFIKENNLDENIIFTGYLNHDNDMPYFNRDADVVVSIPSSDSSPFSVYEAMATKTPVIVSDLPWLKDKFLPGKHLIVIEKINEIILGNKIIRVLESKSNLDLTQAYNIVYNNINVIKENNKLDNLYKKLFN